MPNFRIITEGHFDAERTSYDPRWSNVENFNSKDRIVNNEGNLFDATYQGNKYRIISKEERRFSTRERLGRAFLGTLAVVITLGLALISKKVRELFTLDKITRRYGRLLEQNPNHLSLFFSNTERENPLEEIYEEQDQVLEQKPQPSHPEFKELLKYDWRKEEFRQQIQELSAEEIFECAQDDSFGFFEGLKSYSISDVPNKLNAIFYSLKGNPEKLQAALRGILLHKEHGVVLFSQTIRLLNGFEDNAEREQFFGYLLGIIDQNNPSELVKKIKNFATHYDKQEFQSFIGLIIDKSLQKGDYIERLSMLKEASVDLTDPLIEDKIFSEHSTIQICKNIKLWCSENSIRFEFPIEFLEFEKYKNDERKLYDIIDALINELNTTYSNIRRSKLLKILPLTLKELTIEEIAAFVNKSYSPENMYNWSTDYLHVLKSLSTDRYDAFIESTLTLLSSEQVYSIIAKLSQQSLLSKSEEKVKNKIAEALRAFRHTLTERKYLEEFKRVRGNLEVKKVLENALKSNDGDGFKLIAEEITENELRVYAILANDCFQLDEMFLPTPLQGIFKHLSTEKLLAFTQSALPSLYKRPIGVFLKIVTEADKLEGLKQQTICNYLVQEILKYEAGPYNFIPRLSKESSSEFFGYYLAAIAQFAEPNKFKSLETAYRMNEGLFKAALEKGLQNKGVSKVIEDELKQWFASKIHPQQKELMFLNTTEEISEAFQEYRANPDHVRPFLIHSLGSNPDKIRIVTDLMTVEEIALYSNSENNCFGIRPWFSIYSREISNIIASISDLEKLKAFIRVTLQREECRGQMGLYAMLIMCCNTKDGIRNDLFGTILDSLSSKEFEKLKIDLTSFRDGERNGNILAMKAFAQYCVSIGHTRYSLGLLALTLNYSETL